MNYHTLPVPPKSKADSNRIGVNHKTGRRYVYKADEYTQWKDAITLWLRTLRLPLLTEPFAFHAIYRMPTLRRVDWDNILSGVWDAGKDVCWKDDSLIWELRCHKVLDRTLTEPSLSFAVWPLDPATIAPSAAVVPVCATTT